MMAEKIAKALGGVKGKRIGVLGLSFKPNTNDMREAPSVYIINALAGEGATIKAYDPVAMDDAKAILPSVKFCRSSYEALRSTDAAVLMTEWNQFRNLDLQRIKDIMKKPVFFDLRNVYEPDDMRRLGFQYHCVGRG
jgi:UDPglucose 6-dehydrogenase